MSDFGTHARQRDGLVCGEANTSGVLDAYKLPALGRADREAGSGPMRAAKGPDPVAIRMEGEPPRWRPGLRTQGASLNGWLRIVSAPLRSYDEGQHARS
jgi:hypothetical protein